MGYTVDIPDDLVEYMSDGEGESYESLEQPESLNTKFPTTVVVVGLPVVGQDKYDKLLSLLKSKVFPQYGNMEHIDMPWDRSGKQTLGLAVVTYSTEDEAMECCAKQHGKNLDKAHTCKCVMMDKFQEVISRSDEYKPPAKLATFTRETNRWWLHDARCREQFVIRYQDMTEIFWHDAVELTPQLVYNGERERKGNVKVWTDFKVQWSPLGSYLVTYHKPGIALWGGVDFVKKTRFEHRDVKQVSFAPNEEYVLTWNGSPAAAKDPNAVKIWRVQTGELLRSFPTPSITPRGGEFPHMLWSFDGKYIAKCSEKDISVYQLPEMTLIADPKTPEKGSAIHFPDGLEKFEWSPTADILTVWIPERGNTPSRVVLIDIPSRKDLATKNVFNVRDATMHWQSKGEYLCLNATKQSKSGKTTHTQLEIFRLANLRKGVVPVENLEIKENMKSFHWEPNTNRFSVVVEDETTHAKQIRFYAITDKTIELITKFDMPSNINTVSWAPSGTYLLLASMGPEGVLLFCSLSADGKMDILHKDEHFMLNDIQWDATGRYVCTAVTVPMVSQGTAAAWRYSKEAGYRIWTFQGRLQHATQKESFYQLFWRPQPPPLLASEKSDEVRKKLKEYSKRYDAIDDQLKNAQKAAVEAQRRAAMDIFEAVLASHDDFKQSHPLFGDWEGAWANFDAEIPWEEREIEEEEVLSTKEEIVVS